MPVLRPLWALWGFGAVAMLAGCSAVPPQADPPTTQTTGDVTASSDVQALIETDWQAFVLPGKRATQYRFTTKDGRRAIEAHADSSASMLRRHLNMPADLLSEVSWSWWVDSPLADADLADIDRTDAPARLVFAFDGDKASLPPRARMMFELARVLTGEEPPFATLAYVWATQSPVGSVIKNPRSDRIRKIVVDSGKQQARRWREHRRSLVDDYQNALGVAPGRLIGVAVARDVFAK